MDVFTALRDLESQDYFIWDDFLSPTEVTDVRVDYDREYDEGSFQKTGIGNATAGKNVSVLVRSDETHWLDPLDLTVQQKVFWDRLEVLKKSINEKFLLGLWTLEGHYSRYPITGFYQKHLDRFRSDDVRTVSMVLYQNEGWKKGDGGELRIHRAEGLIPALIDIEPLGGRLVCFLSAEVLHEVLVTQELRSSFAGWWKRRASVKVI